MGTLDLNRLRGPTCALLPRCRRYQKLLKALKTHPGEARSLGWDLGRAGKTCTPKQFWANPHNWMSLGLRCMDNRDYAWGGQLLEGAVLRRRNDPRLWEELAICPWLR